MKLDCDRWIQLSDLEALGESLAGPEREFLRTHAAGCPQCGREAALFRDLRLPNVHAEPEERDLERTLTLIAATGAQPVAARRPSSPWGAGVAAIGALACAAAFTLWMTGSAERAHQPLQAASQVDIGELRGSDVPAKVTGPSCSAPSRGVRLCVASGTVLRTTAVPADQATLLKGRAALVVTLSDGEAPFAVQTPRGVVAATRGTFSIETLADGTTTARVSDGAVTVRGREESQPARLVSAGQSFRLGDGEASALPAAERARDRELLLHVPR